MSHADKAERLPYCGYCGAKMRERFYQEDRYDRQTGRRIECGWVYWSCSKGIGPYRGWDGEPGHDSQQIEYRAPKP